MRLLADEPEPLCLVKECQELEDYFETHTIGNDQIQVQMVSI